MKIPSGYVNWYKQKIKVARIHDQIANAGGRTIPSEVRSHNLYFKDTMKPTFSVVTQYIEVGKYSEIDWTTRIYNVKDNSLDELKIEHISGEVKLDKVGKYFVVIEVTDKSENSERKGFWVYVTNPKPTPPPRPSYC